MSLHTVTNVTDRAITDTLGASQVGRVDFIRRKAHRAKEPGDFVLMHEQNPLRDFHFWQRD